MKRLVPILWLALLPVAVQAADASRILQAVSPAAELKQLTLDAGVGQLKVSASPDDSVHVQVKLEQKSQNFLWFFHWMSHSTAKAIAQVTLQQQQQDSAITYSLKYPNHLDDSDIKQNWVLQVPARLEMKITMKVGQITVNDIGGGVNASLNVGEMTLNTPHGPMRATVNVGQIRATSGSTQPGNIKLSTTIGDARLYMKGWNNRDDVHHSGLGSSINVDNKGSDQMDMDVNIGEVSLHIEPSTDGNSK
jgi:hypothetical protein